MRHVILPANDIASISSGSDVMKSKTDGAAVVVIAAPVFEGAVVRGVVVASLDLSLFEKNFLSKIKVLQSGYAFMAQGDGVVIAHPDAAYVLALKLTERDRGRGMKSEKHGQIHYTIGGPKSSPRSTGVRSSVG